MELINDLVTQSSSYDFFQAMRLLEQHYGDSLQRLTFSPATQLTFPATDIKSGQLDAKQVLKLELNFMGFYGIDSPLPQYFATFLVHETTETKAIKEFLNIFNQRLYRLLYFAYKKYRSILQLADKNSRHIKYLIALSGNGLHTADLDEFAFAGMMGARNRNVSGLIGLLRDYLQLDAVTVATFIPRWLTTDNQPILGQPGISLGQNTLIGNKILDINGKISIKIGPISAERAEELLPKKPKGQRLQHLIKRYLGPLLTFDIQLKIDLPKSDGFLLGKSQMQLGWLLNLGEVSNINHSIIINYN